ncbi:MAG: putative 7-carboxy-7-deazaguanine synthase QueE [Eubacterium sp.]|nr:putative 7-carboxy-7-deazaguanine synthase QueE [Eubacterium sp.]
MKVVEKFVSINGEGPRAGELAVFLRFKGCNLRCSYCDTMWANEPDCPYVEETPQELYDYVKSTKVKNVTLTGGEPLLQQEMVQLLKLLTEDEELRVEVETNGAINLKMFTARNRPVFTMDYKLPSSQWEHAMLTGNFSVLQKEDTVKFVCGSREDMDRAVEMIKKYDLINRCHVYFSPVFGKIEPADMVEYMIRNQINDARLQIQMHKVIWNPERRGV